MSGGVYSDADKTREQAFCSIDFYAGLGLERIMYAEQ